MTWLALSPKDSKTAPDALIQPHHGWLSLKPIINTVRSKQVRQSTKVEAFSGTLSFPPRATFPLNTPTSLRNKFVCLKAQCLFTRTRLQQARTAHALARLGFSWMKAAMGVFRSERSMRRGWLLILPHCVFHHSSLTPSMQHSYPFWLGLTLSRFFWCFLFIPQHFLFRAALLVSTSMCVKPSVASEQLALFFWRYSTDASACVILTRRVAFVTRLCM